MAASVGAAVAVLVAEQESTRRAENATREWAEERLLLVGAGHVVQDDADWPAVVAGIHWGEWVDWEIA